MMRRRAMRRGPGLVRTAARTAVVAGTATAVVGGVQRHQASKDEARAEAEQTDQMVAQQQAAEQVPAAAPPPGDDMIAKLEQLSALHASGVLDDAEFAAAKAKLLA